jgi:hypothetical protein
MDLDPARLCVVLKVVNEWGPEMRRPALDRILERLPSITKEEAEALRAEADRISGEVFSLAERAYHGDGFDQYSGRDELGRLFPHLDGSTLDYLWSKGGYYAWHG